MWIMRRFTAAQVNACVPKYITQAQADAILQMEQAK